METLVKDLRFALRTLLKNPVVTGAAVASLAIGIGANTTIFTLVNAVFLRGLPVEEPERLVALFTTDEKAFSGGGPLGNLGPVSRLNYEDYRDRNRVFSELAAYGFAGANLSGREGEPEQIAGQLVTGNYFRALGTSPAAGRFFLAEEDATPGAHPVAVLSHAFWKRRFGADRGLIGDTINLNGQAFTVVGVAPQGFNGTFVLGNVDFWAPAAMHDTFLTGTLRQWWDERRALMLFSFGRLRSGVDVSEAEAAMQVVGRNLAAEYPIANENRSVALLPLNQASIPPGLRDNFVRAGGLMMTVVGLVLLIACANVANLLLVRATRRRKEIAVRLSLGAARWRLVRQLLTESLVLAVLAGALGLLLAHWGRSLLWSTRPPFLQQANLDLAFDPLVLAFTIGISMLTGLAFGLVPALRASRPDIVNDLKPQTAGTGEAARTLGLKNLLVVGQVALSLVALIGSGLFLRSLANAMQIDPGFDSDRLSTLTFDVGAQGYEPARGEQFFQQAVERAESVPGVESAALASGVPLGGGGPLRTVFVEGRDPEAENNGVLVQFSIVGLGYFETTGIPAAAGRLFSELDREETPLVAVINETMAKRFWPDEEALGRRFYFFGQEGQYRQVVGIVEDTKYNTIGEDPIPFLYLPLKQNYNATMTLFVRSADKPESVVGTIRKEVQMLDPTLPLTNIQTMSEVVAQSLWNARMAAGLLGLLGLLALALAAVGLYGVMSYVVSQRNREIGVRMALGAGRTDVLRLFINQGMAVVAAGILIGLATAWFGSRAIVALLYGIAGPDLTTFGLTTLVLAAVALLATFLPARRATRIDPVVALRYE